MRIKDISGQRFGMLLALDPVFGGRAVSWRCSCECGKYRVVDGYKLRSGHTKSCGCLVGVERVQHGRAYTHEYRIWAGIKQRCRNPKNTHYRNYGERGIKVCEEWADSFKAFFDSVGECPSYDHTIERIDTNKGYYAGNVRWATRKENQRNLRSSKRWVVCESEYESLSHAAEELGISKSTVQRWCDGGKNNGKQVERRPGCRSYKIYGDEK